MVSRKKAPQGARAESMADTREALLSAGATLFSERGIDGPSLDAICERAGYTRGAFYVHFRDRDDFLVAVMEREGLPLLDTLLGGAETGPSTLEEVVARFVDEVSSGRYPLTRDGGPKPHQLLDACARSRTLKKRYVGLLRESVARLAQVAKGSQAAQTLRSDVDPEALATLLLAAVLGAQTMLELDAPLDLPASAAALMRLLAPVGGSAR